MSISSLPIRPGWAFVTYRLKPWMKVEHRALQILEVGAEVVSVATVSGDALELRRDLIVEVEYR